MKGLIEKPHFDEKVFAPGTALRVKFPREPYDRRGPLKRNCLVLGVNKDSMKLVYVPDNQEECCTETASINAESVKNGEVEIKFLVEEKGE